MKKIIVLTILLVSSLLVTKAWAPPPGGSGGPPLNNLQDMKDVTKPLNPADQDALIFDSATSKWIATPQAAAGGGDNLGDHTATETIQMDGNDLAEATTYGGNAYMGTYYGNDAILKGPQADVRAYGAVGDG